MQSEPGAVLIKKKRKYYVNENKTSGISPNKLVIILDETRLPRTWAVYKLVNFLMENIHPQQSHRQCCWMCYVVHASPFPNKTAVSRFVQFSTKLALNYHAPSRVSALDVQSKEEGERRKNRSKNFKILPLRLHDFIFIPVLCCLSAINKCLNFFFFFFNQTTVLLNLASGLIKNVQVSFPLLSWFATTKERAKLKQL